MGYLFHIALALGLQALVENGFSLGRELWMVVPLFALVPVALGRWVRDTYLAGKFRRASIVHQLLVRSAPLLQLAALSVCGWERTVERITGVHASLLGWPHPALLLVLAPYVVYELVAIDARARASDVRPSEIARTSRFHARMLASSLVPLALYVIATWAIGSNEVVRANIERVTLWSLAFAVLLLAGFVTLLPTLLRLTWDTAPMRAGPERALLEELARRARFECRELLVWNTGQQMANAAVVGLGARGRLVLFSDALLAQLSPRELLAVFAHEIGHVARHHVRAFLALSLGFFLSIDLLIGWLAPESELIGGGMLAAGLVLWYLGFGYLSRRYELDADLHSLDLLGDLDALVGALEQVGSPHGRQLSSWRHFSTADRIAFLGEAAQRPEVALALRRKLRVASIGGALLLAVALVLQGVSLARSYPEERVLVEASLGNYASASERLARLDDPDPDFARQLERAAQLAPGSATVGVDTLERAAREALARNELDAAVDLLSLAAARGREDLELVVRALDADSDEDRRASLERLAEVAPAWGAEVERFLAARADQ